jgi:hypothetical protein
MARQQREITPDDLKPGSRPDIDMTNGMAGREREEILLVDRPLNQSTTSAGRGSRIPNDAELAELQFMEEEVLIRLEQSPSDEKPVMCYPFSVNGRTAWVPPNRPFTVKRKYLEVILRSQPFTVETDVFKPGDRDERQVMHRYQSRRFNVTILNEPNKQRGAEWATRVMLES